MAKPKKYQSVEEIQPVIDEYISECTIHERPMTYTGLSYALGFSSRTTLWNYSKRDDALSEPVKRAMLRIEQDYEEGLRSGSPTGSIFALKNRGWSDKTEIEHSTVDDDGKKTGFKFVDGPKDRDNK